MVFPPTAPWWSAGLNAAGYIVPFAGRRWGHARPRHAGRLLERGFGCFRRRRRGGRRGLQRRREGRAFRWTALGGMQGLGTLGGYRSMAYAVSADGSVVVGWADQRRRAVIVPFAGRRWVGCKTSARCRDTLGAMLLMFPPTAPWWSAGLKTPQGRGVPFAGRRLVGCKTSARWAAIGSEAYGVSADGSVVVGWLKTSGFDRAFRWTASRGMEDLNTTYASLLTNGSGLGEPRAISPDGRYIVGWGYNAATRRGEAFLLDTGFPRRGDVDRNGCVDDADLLQVLFAFGGRGYRNEDLNWDGTVDDADLLEVLFNFGSGC
jgi:probable HAF family extracellular repeat protein